MQHVLVTGSNRGIGLELVRQYLSRDDYSVFATCRNPAQATALQTLTEAYPDRLYILEFDVANLEKIQKVADQVRSSVSHLDILINNAGMNPSGQQSLDKINAETMVNVFQVNAVAPLMIVKAFVPLLKQSNHPRIVNVSTQKGSMEWNSFGGSYAYSTSKAALNMITRLLSADLKEITTITLHPGWVQTDMGGEDAPLTVEESARGILELTDRLSLTDSGKFFKWNGEIHAW